MLDALMGRLAMSRRHRTRSRCRQPGRIARACPLCSTATHIAPHRHGATALNSLPLEALRLPAPMSSDLRILGFERVSDLLAQPRGPLTLRFGPELGRRIEQALGTLADSLKPVRPPDLLEVRRSFPMPADQEQYFHPSARRLKLLSWPSSISRKSPESVCVYPL